MQTYATVEDPRLYYLKSFQAKRLQTTYADFAVKPNYEAACDFFFNRVYSVEDSGDRDASFKNIYKNVRRFLGGQVERSMAKLIELQDLTVALDEKLLEVLVAMDAPVEFDSDTYEKAYRWSDNKPERELQIELLVFVNHLIYKISHRFGIGAVLKGLRAACLVTGDTRMVDFLTSGYRAYAKLKSIKPLVEAIQQRETDRLERIFSSYPAPPADLGTQKTS